MSLLRSKDEELLQQSRFLLMGEMISMLAHQWRQPLATISMLINNIELSLMQSPLYEKNAAFLKQLGGQVGYLSTLIDDFRKFYKPDREKQWFVLDETIESAWGIIGSSLKSDGIEA